MNLLGAINYDPGTAVSKVTTSLVAMTAFDTTNLRIAFTIPAHGIVMVKITCVHHGSTTTAQVLLGCLEGATIRGRASVTPNLLGTAIATTRTKLEASFILTGLTPGAVSWDAAYGVEIVSSANGAIKYGGPNNTTTDNAFGGFNFEIWDPKPAPANWSLESIDANGRVDVIKVAGTTQTARDLGASVLLSSGTGTGQLDFTSGVVKANTTQFNGSNVVQSGGRPEVNTTHLAGSAIDATSGLINANVKQISTDATAADNAELFFDGTGYAGGTTKLSVNMTQIDGLATNGTNATLNLKRLNILNSGVPAVTIQSVGNNAVNIVSDIDAINLQGDVAGIAINSSVGNAITLSAQGINPTVYVEGTNSGAVVLFSDTDAALWMGSTSGYSVDAPQDIHVSDGLLTLAAIANAVWINATRTITSFGTLVSDIWNNATRTLTAISDSAGVTTLLSRIASTLNISSGKVESNVKQVNDTDLTGDGSSGNPWGPA